MPQVPLQHGTRSKKPIFKTWWFWVIVVIAVAAIASAANGGDEPSMQSFQIVAAQTARSVESKAQDSAEVKKEEQQVPADYTSALRQAKNYSKMMHMSKQGIYDQLTSDYGGQFSDEAAQYAVDHVQADWNANALAAAKNYQKTMAMSPEAIRDQLTSPNGDQFTQDEADYAVAHLND